mgnify:CR=1 FL=1
MDIGGGSTEFAFGTREGESVSLSTGVVVLSTVLPLSDPPDPWELRAVSHYAARRIEDGTRPFGRGFAVTPPSALSCWGCPCWP